jgi:two-component system response regulator PilR (NtrC family)
MIHSPRRVLVADDDSLLVSSLTETLGREEGLRCWGATNKATALRLLGDEAFDLLLASSRIEKLMADVHQQFPDVPVISIVERGHGSDLAHTLAAGAAAALSRADARDVAKLLAAVRRVLSGHRRAARHAAAAVTLVGDCPALTAVVQLVKRLAPDPSPVLITGETGTGKELVAQMLHDLGDRPGPFVAINCAAMPEHLLESELFGHVKGAFTGAHEDKVGLAQHADHGTLFLDEIGAMPLRLQAKLLRFLQEGTVRRVGANTHCTVSVRVLAAANTDLEDALVQQSFRSDLFYRLHVLTVALPPLRARDGDVVVLARYFARQKAEQRKRPVPELAQEVLAALKEYPWPGNVRELEHAIERAVALTANDVLQLQDLPARVLRQSAAPAAAAVGAAQDLGAVMPLRQWLRVQKRVYAERTLAACRGNHVVAARQLGIATASLYRALRLN